MTLFSRLRTVTLAYGNNLLDKVVDGNSIPVLKQYVRDLEDAIDKLNHEDAVAAANITILQSQIDATSKAVALDTQRAQAYLAKNDEAHARLVAVRIHDSQVLLDSYKEQISQGIASKEQLDTALAQLNAKHTDAMGSIRRLESEDRQARSMESATHSLHDAAALNSNDVSSSVDSISAKIHQRSVVANEELNRAVGSFAAPPDPLKDAAVDDILAGLRPKEEPVAA